MRIHTLMIVGPGEADRYLPEVLDRAFIVSDTITCVLDPAATGAEESVAREFTDCVEQTPSYSWGAHEGKFRQFAWETMEWHTQPDLDDYVLVLDADELIVDTDPIQKAAREHQGRRLGFTFYEMFSMTSYRVDGHWKPYVAWIMIPYRREGRVRDRAMASGREPTYATSVRRVDAPIASVLHYGYARAEDRKAKHDRYMEIDGGKYHSLEHLKSIMYPPQLKEWEGGGRIVERAE
jgi:hypothetical protein